MSIDNDERLAKYLASIRGEEAQMRKALRTPGKLLFAIKHATSMLAELRTSNLAPKQYYELYSACFDALTQLSSYLREDHKNHHLADVYEFAQYTGNIIPRLYLMITVGSAFLASGDAPVKEVLKDMLEMSRGIQNPIRGLFLRYYLGQMTRSYLPTATPEDLASSIKFTLTNLIEMNKLWVRLQHQGHSRERPKRTAERKELQIIVGSNLLRLAQLDHVDATVFREMILPHIDEQVIQCHDVMAQEYLLDAVCQAFPAEFHIRTLDKYLDTVTKLNPDTSLPVIFHASISRLLQYASEPSESPRSSSPHDVTGESIRELNIDDTTAPEKQVENDAEKLSGEATDAKTETEVDTKAEGATEAKTEAGANEEVEANTEAETDVKTEANTEAERDVNIEAKTEADPEADAEPENKSDDKSESQEKSRDEVGAEADTTVKEENADAHEKIERTEKELLLEDAIHSYWDTLLALGSVRQVPVADKALIVCDLLKLANAVGHTDVEGPLKYVASSQNIPASVEIETLVMSLFDTVPLLNVLHILQTFPGLLENQSVATKERVASRVLKECLASSTHISDYKVAEQVFDLFGLIMKSGEDTTRLAELLHLLGGGNDTTTDLSSSLKLFQLAHKSLRAGGVPVVQKTYGVLSSVVIHTLKKNPTSAPTPSTDSPIFKFLNRTIYDLAAVGGMHELAFRHYMLAAAAADERGAEEAAYEFFVQAFTLYEESITDSRAQYAALAIAIGLLQSSTSFNKDNYETLATRCTMYGAKLLRKPDQCHAVLLASHLWLPETEANEAPDKILETLQRALKIADSTMDSEVSIELFCDVLDRYLYFLLLEVPTVTATDVSELIKVVRTNLEAAGDAAAQSSKRLDRIIDYIGEEPALSAIVL